MHIVDWNEANEEAPRHAREKRSAWRGNQQASLTELLRKEGHKNYKECGDKYARNFIKGLAIRYRG